jgi:hypothetical protein
MTQHFPTRRPRIRRGFAEVTLVVTTITLVASIAVAATIVSIGIARAGVPVSLF